VFNKVVSADEKVNGLRCQIASFTSSAPALRPLFTSVLLCCTKSWGGYMQCLRTTFALFAAAVLVACAGQTRSDWPTMHQKFDMQSFMGKWYIIANIPYFAEKGKVGSYVVYRQRDDGRIDDLFSFRKKTLTNKEQRWDGITSIVDDKNPAHMRARFIWPFSTDFLVLHVSADGNTALVGTPDRKLAWIYSRTVTITPEQYARSEAMLRAQGYPVEQLVKIPQLSAMP
jgi:apolipoprotein D and lipocalin family protein